jgi:arsenate reductase
MLVTRRIKSGLAFGYFLAQFLGGVFGALLADLMFSKSAFSMSSVERAGSGLLLGELVASIGLVLLILLLLRFEKSNLIAAVVPAWIFAGYFFTSSTSFANPAVTLGRAFSEAASSIALKSVPSFVFIQFAGAGIALVIFALLQPKTER